MGRLADALRSFVLGPYSSGDPALARLFGGTPPAAGVAVTEYTALNFSAVWQAVAIIAGGIAALPLITYKRRPDGGKDRFPDHPLYRLLHDEPNPEMSAMVWRETTLAHALTWGNGYSEIEFDQAGRPVALWPLTPDRVTPYRDSSNKELRYRVQNETDGNYVTATPDQIFHVPGLGFDGVCGYSVIRKARESVSLGLAAERFGARFFGTGALFSIALEHPAKLSKDAQARLKETWNEQHGGLERSHGVTVLEEGMKATKLSIPPEDAQFLESRKFQVVEIARWFNLSPRKLRDIEKAASYSSVEQDAIDHVTDSLRPWMVRIEQEINRKLVSRLERRRMFAEHLVDGLLRGDISSRFQAYAVGRNWGWLSADDVRERENMNPLPGGQGQMYLVPLSMAPADDLPTTKDRVDAVGALVRAGYDPAAALKALGLPTIEHLGAPPVTVQPLDNYEGAAARGGGGFGQPGGGGEPKPDGDPEPEPEPKPERALTNGHDPARRARQIAAQRAVFVEGVGRMVRREGKAIRAALKKGPAAFRAWVPEFYEKHAAVVASALVPAVQAHLSVIESDAEPLAAARALADSYCTESLSALLTLLQSEIPSFDDIETLVSRWEIERPPQMADAIMAEEIAHAIA